MSRSSLTTVIAVAIVAYAADDMVHEVLGHGFASLFFRDVKLVSLSTVALQSSGGQHRMIAASGTVANLIAGLLSLWFVRRDTNLSTRRFFLWLFAAVNLMNGIGYLLFSGALNVGDWAVVIAGLQPHWAWRAGLSVLGLIGYIAVIHFVADGMSRLIDSGMERGEVHSLVYTAYIAGGLLFVAGAALNPISPMLILTSGVSTAFGGMVGLLFVPGIVERMRAQSYGTQSLTLDRRWLFAGALVGIAFIAVIGPGVRF